MKCCLCKGQIEDKGYWNKGNNAEPLKTGRCCDTCNATKVIPARLKALQESRRKEDEQDLFTCELCGQHLTMCKC